jgi:hypothetical protein
MVIEGAERGVSFGEEEYAGVEGFDFLFVVLLELREGLEEGVALGVNLFF